MKLELQRQELESIRDLINEYLEIESKCDCEGWRTKRNIGVAITNRLTRETLLVNIKEINCLGKVEFTIGNELKEVEGNE